MMIHSIDVTDCSLPEVSFDVVCSKGTYVRTLCHDIGLKLKCFAHMISLRRFLHGSFDLSMAVTLDRIEDVGASGLSEYLLSPLEALVEMPRYLLNDEAYSRLLNGIPPAIEEVQPASICADNGDLVCLVYNENLLAVARYEPQRQNENRGDFCLQKVFLPDIV
jgi:tRNA pseudouridine55 synthase